MKSRAFLAFPRGPAGKLENFAHDLFLFLLRADGSGVLEQDQEKVIVADHVGSFVSHVDIVGFFLARAEFAGALVKSLDRFPVPFFVQRNTFWVSTIGITHFLFPSSTLQGRV